MKTLAMFALLAFQETPEERRIEQKISQVKATVAFEDTPLAAVVDYLREVADVNIVIDAAAAALDIRVNLQVAGLSVKSILKLALAGKKAGTLYENDVLLVTAEDRLRRKIVMELYDIRDLLFPLQDFPGEEFDLNQNGLGGVFADADPGGGDEPLPVEDLVLAHTGGGYWDENPEAGCSLNNGILVVRATKEIHAQVRRLLDVLRANK